MVQCEKIGLSLGLLLVLCVLTISQVVSIQKNIDYKLELLQVMFRHGDRTPETYECYPKDRYKRWSFSPYGRGQLTFQGKRRASNLGNVLKNLYGDFLGQYKEGDVFAYHTNSSRTKETLNRVLSRLYPNNQIPTFTKSRRSDDFYLVLFCQKFNELLNETKHLPEVQDELKSYEKLFKYLSENTGLEVDLKYAFLISSTLRNEKANNLPLPAWCTKKILLQLDNVVELLYKIYTYTPMMRKLIDGPILNNLLTNIEYGKDAKKIVLLSVHDANIKLLLRGIDLQPDLRINYAATLILEKLRGSDEQIYIRILFYPGEGSTTYVLKLSNCATECSYDKFLKIIDPIRTSFGEEPSLCKSDSKYVNDIALIIQNKCP